MAGPRWQMPVLIVVLLIFIGVLVWVAPMLSPTSTPTAVQPTQPDSTSQQDAPAEAMTRGRLQVKCRDVMKRALPSPATARFEGGLFGAADVKGSSAEGWQLRSYVDSQNVNGADVRTYFTCITPPGGTEVQIQVGQ